MNRKILKGRRKKPEKIVKDSIDISDIQNFSLLAFERKNRPLHFENKPRLSQKELLHELALVFSNELNDDSTVEYSILELRMALDRGDSGLVTRALRRAIQQGSRELEATHMKCIGVSHWHPGCNTGQRLNAISALQIAMIDATITEICSMPSEQVLVDTFCLKSYNDYQFALYERFDQLKEPTSSDPADKRRCETEHLINILLTALATHREYSDKNIRVTKDFSVDLNYLEPLMKDPHSIYMRYLSYAMYELYYRKLDYSIATIILDNIHSLKMRLKLPDKVYQEIECAIYYFIYRTDEDWKYYMPENRPQYVQHIKNCDVMLNIKVLHDPNRLLNGPVIYLEWKKFRKCMSDFENVLSSIDVKSNLKPEGTQLNKSEENTLTLLPYLRDEYSLKKMSEYLKVLDEKDTSPDMMLVVQRVAQVTGEMLLCTDTLHLSPRTRALLNAELPEAPLHKLTQLRNELSKIRDGKMSKRMNLESTQPEIYTALALDLIQIRKGINEIIKIYTPIVAKALLKDGLNLLRERMAEWPFQARCLTNDIKDIFTKYNEEGIPMAKEEWFINVIFKRLGFSRQFFREIGLVNLNIDNLNDEMKKQDIKVIKAITKKLLNYTKIVKNHVNVLRQDLVAWNTIIQELTDQGINIVIKDYPNDSCKKNMEKEIKIKKKAKVLGHLIKRIKDVPERDAEWNEIKYLLEFIVMEVLLCDTRFDDTERSASLNLFNDISNGYPNDFGLNNIDLLLREIETKYKNKTPTVIVDATHQYKGIDDLRAALKSAKGECGRLDCLCERAAALRRITRGNDTVSTIQALWESDDRSRIACEAAVSDIHMLLYQGLGIPPRRTPGQILAEFPHRNILQHGSPLLDVLGARLDPDESLIPLVLDVFADDACWRELRELRGLGFHRDEACVGLHLSPEAKRSPRWKRYLPLMPEATEFTPDLSNQPNNVISYLLFLFMMLIHLFV